MRRKRSPRRFRAATKAEFEALDKRLSNWTLEADKVLERHEAVIKSLDSRITELCEALGRFDERLKSLEQKKP